jgi:hypothetical protein
VTSVTTVTTGSHKQRDVTDVTDIRDEVSRVEGLFDELVTEGVDPREARVIADALASDDEV